MSLFQFKKKVTAEDFGKALVLESIPKAIKYFTDQNSHARQSVPLKDAQLATIGSGVVAYFLYRQFPEANGAPSQMFSRCLSGIRKGLRANGGNIDRMGEWLKTFMDEEKFQRGDEPVGFATKTIWTRTFPETPFQDHPAVKGFAYFLQMEVKAVEKLKLV